MTPVAALAAMAPVMTEAQGVLKSALDRLKVPFLELGFNDDLDIVKPGTPGCVFVLRLTPQLIMSVAGIGLCIYIVWWFATHPINWDPLGLGNIVKGVF